MIFDDRPRIQASWAVVADYTTSVEPVVYVIQVVTKDVDVQDFAKLANNVAKMRESRPWKYRANRNDYCPCGSLKKFKHCYWGKRKGDDE